MAGANSDEDFLSMILLDSAHAHPQKYHPLQKFPHRHNVCGD
jgi:hypothetical protein